MERNDLANLLTGWLPALGVLGAMMFGAWWTADAVQSGRPLVVVLRFGLGAVLAVYYLILCRAVRNQAVPDRDR